MQNKYYTPDISDIRVGYETFFITEGLGIVHKPFIVTRSNINVVLRDINLVKSTYLTKEDIEKEGWVHKNVNLFELRKNDVLYFLYFSDTCLITEETKFKILFQGEIKSINELRYITNNLLKIK